MPPQLQQLPLSPPPTTMTTNHQNHNQITNPNPQPNHHSPPTTRKRKTTLQNHNQITNPQPHYHQQSKKEKEKQSTKITNLNPQPHHHQQLEKEKEKQPPRESKSTSMPSLMAWSVLASEAASESAWLESSEVASHWPPQFQWPPRRSKTHVELLADDPRRSSLNLDAHASQRPTNLDPQNQVTPLSSSTSISEATLRRRSGFRVQWCLGVEVPSQWTLEGRSSNHEIERNRSYRKERRGKWERREKIEEKNKIF